MFNLEKAITLWKNEFEKNDSFTNEDIEELEGHLLDKIDALTKSGLTQEEAFIKANENIGTAEVLHNDFSTVNKIGILSKRIILGLFGYMFIVFLNDIVRVITTSIIVPFAKNLIDIPVSKNSLPGMIMNFLFGSRSNMLGQVSLIISSLLSIILIYIVLSKKINIINKLANKVNKNIYSKSNLSVSKVIITMIMLTLLVILTPGLGTMMNVNISPNEIGNIYMGISCSRLVFDFMLAFIFIYKLYGKSRVNNNLSVSLGGYLIGNTLIIIIPTIVESIIFSIGVKGLVWKYIYIIMYLLVTAIVTFMIIGINKKVLYKSNNNRLKDRNFKRKILLGSVISFIYSGINLVIIPLRVFMVGNSRFGEFAYIEDIMHLVIIIIAQFIVSIILIRKIKIYRKVA